MQKMGTLGELEKKKTQNFPLKMFVYNPLFICINCLCNWVFAFGGGKESPLDFLCGWFLVWMYAKS